MRFNVWSLALLASSSSLGSAKLNYYAQKAGLKYFGSATDSPGQRERAGYEADYPEYDAILDNYQEFGQTTPTNGQKWAFTEPSPGVFNYTEGEIVTDLAAKTGKYLRCHTLVYWASMAMYVYETAWTSETLTEAINQHVANVAGHWKGQCYAWDVANEALADDGSYSETFLYEILGEDWIKIAFKAAAAADPDAKLYYNDAGIESPGPKADGALRIIKMLQDEGLRIDGIGLQSHMTAGAAPTIDDYISAIDSYGDAGVEVALTELDVGIIPPVNTTSLAWQREDYKNIVGACVQADACIGITVWDFYDPFSWLPEYTNRTNGTIYFSDFTRHPAYYGALEALKNATEIHPTY